MDAALDERDVGLQPGAPPVSVTPGNELAAPTFDAPTQPVEGGTLSPPPVAQVPGNTQTGLPELGPVPEAPGLTGNPQQDVLLNLQHQRDLAEYGAKLQAHKAELDKQTAAVLAKKADRELEEQKRAQEQREVEQRAFAAQRQARQKQLDQAVDARAAAAKDLEGHDPTSGAQLVAIIAGGIGAALQNYGAAQASHAGTAQNEALNAINAINQRDYQRKKDRLQAASDALLEARYGFKDAEDNHRAAQNDIDADMAARYKLIGAEAEQQLRRAGVPAAEIATNAIVLDARQKQAAAEAAIHEREEKMAGERQHYASEEALANAHLGLQERQIQATAQSRRDTLAERHWEHSIAQADRLDKKRAGDDAKKAAAAEKKEARALRDENTGELLGYAPTPRNVDKLADQLSKTDMYVDAVDKLAKHIEEHGHLLNPLSAEYKERESLAANVQALGRGVKGIQASDAGQKLEHMVIGGTGTGIGRMAAPKVLRQLADEARTSTRRHLTAELEPPEGETKARESSGSAAPSAPKLSDADVSALKAVKKDDPRYDRAQALLKSAGK